MKRTVIFITMLVMVFLMGTNAAFADYYSGNVVLKYGMQGTEVTNLQNDLKNLGYFNFGTTGYFGSLTKQSVVGFQQANGLTADGIVGHGTAREIKVEKILKLGKSLQGVPYVWGGVSPSGFDCSGFVHYTFLKNGITLPRMSEDQYKVGTWVSKSQLRQGDLVFFTTYKPGPSHVGIYLGGGKFVHASSGAEKVTISELSNPYYTSHYIGAKRVIQ